MLRVHVADTILNVTDPYAQIAVMNMLSNNIFYKCRITDTDADFYVKKKYAQAVLKNYHKTKNFIHHNLQFSSKVMLNTLYLAVKTNNPIFIDLASRFGISLIGGLDSRIRYSCLIERKEIIKRYVDRKREQLKESSTVYTWSKSRTGKSDIDISAIL